MLQIGAWICFLIALVAFVELVRDYKKEEAAFKHVSEDTEDSDF